MAFRRCAGVALCAFWAVTGVGVAEAGAAEWFVAAGGTGPGSSAAPFGRIQDAIGVAQPGDTVTVRSGVYSESLRTVRPGIAGLPVRLRAEGARGTTVITFAGRVLNVTHAYLQVERLVLDGQYSDADTVVVANSGSFLTLKDVEVRRSSKDLIDIRAPQGVLIDGCLIHHALNATGGRTDAHGIVAGAARDLTIRNTEIHTFSGDGFQIDPGRAAPGWDRVTIEGSRIWLAPLPAAENGFPAGSVPGENAVDTKAGSTLPRARITIRDTTAWGFRGGLISNMAAFNLKENITAIVDGVTVFDSEIAFRLRGAGSASWGAWVTVKNAVVYDVAKAFRYEDDIQNLKIWNSTIGRNVTSPFQAASSGSGGLEVRNLLVLGTSRPSQASHTSNLNAGAEAFVDVNANNYALVAGSVAVDAGVALPEVTIDRVGTSRPQGATHDTGAHEWIPAIASGDVIVHAGKHATVAGGWQAVPDAGAANGTRLWHPDAGTPNAGVMAQPLFYFDVDVWVEAGKSYRVWLRGKAEANRASNDSAYVQFSGSLSVGGSPRYRIGTTSAMTVTLRECSACILSGWGWQDNGDGVNGLGPLVKFATTGRQTVRVQTREDGFSIDQIVLSPSTYLMTAPGPVRDDTTILPEQ
jgi:hypothetical protein